MYRSVEETCAKLVLFPITSFPQKEGIDTFELVYSRTLPAMSRDGFMGNPNTAQPILRPLKEV